MIMLRGQGRCQLAGYRDGEGDADTNEIQPGKHGQDELTTQIINKNKRRKVVHHRSKLTAYNVEQIKMVK